MIKTLIAGVAFLALVSAAFAHSGKHESDAKFTKHFNDTLFAISEKSQVSIEILLDEKEYKIGRDVIGIVIHDSHDEDVEDAKLVVSVVGSDAALKVKEKGGGLYLVPNSGLPREGAWKLSISVKKKKMEDGAVFSFPEVLNKKVPAGKYPAGQGRIEK